MEYIDSSSQQQKLIQGVSYPIYNYDLTDTENFKWAKENINALYC